MKTYPRSFKEDSLFDNMILEYIVGAHGFKDYHVFRHVRYSLTDEEFDVVVYGRQRKNIERIACIELKDSDFDKLLIQTISRIPHCHYVYGIIYSLILTPNTPELLEKAINRGVGLIQYRNQTYTIMRHARLQRDHSDFKQIFLKELKETIQEKTEAKKK